MGRFTSSRLHLEEVLALYDPISHHSVIHRTGDDPHVVSLAFLAIVFFCLGFPDQAMARSTAAIAAARTLAHPPSLAVSLNAAARLFALVGDNAALEQRVAELISLATEQGFPHWRGVGTIYRGWLQANDGNVTRGLCLLRSGAATHRSTGAESLRPYHIALLASAHEIAGQIEAAATQLDDALQIVERTGERWFEAELNRHKGRLMLRQGHSEAAEELYRKGLSIARQQEAKLWELRAAVSLARLRRDQGRRAEARDLLAPVYGWFTEGFATQDLKEAKALLDDLGGAWWR
jgi:predicted ATPase